MDPSSKPFFSAVSPCLPLIPRSSTDSELKSLSKGQKLFCIMAPFSDSDIMEACADKGVDAFAMEFMPRITRAQSMDVLSSQANLAGYKAVIEAANAFGRAFPQMMTAADRQDGIAPGRG